MKSTKWCSVFVVVLSILCMSFLSFGQSTSGSIQGNVTDPAGAAMSNVQVTLTNTGTNNKLQMVTNAQGTYTFRNLMVGLYSVRVEAPGFSIQERTGLQLDADQSVTADIQMQISGNQSSVEVSSDASVLDTQNSDLADVIPSSTLLSMPVLSRQDGSLGIYSDLYFMPGAQNPNSNSVGNGAGNDSGEPTIDGARQLDTMITMDGMVVMANVGDEGGTPVQPSEEADQEIHTVLADAPAEFWRSAAITVVSKSGTNELHGSLYEDYNGSAMNSRSYFADSVPFRVDNNFAVSMGGPIVKDKLFYFGDYEGGREIGRVIVDGDVPLPAWRTGDFSSLPANSIINPYTGQPFQSNQIPAGMISSVSNSLQAALYPLPNYGPAGLQAGNYRTLIPALNGFQDFNKSDATINYTLSAKDTMFVRESYSHMPVASFLGNLPAVGHYVENRTGASGVITESHIFSPNLINELRLGYTDMRLAYNQAFNGLGLVTQAGIQGPLTSYSPIPDVPSITVTSITSTAGTLPDTNDTDIDYEWNDNLSWTRGKHALQFGFDQVIDRFAGLSNPGSIFGSYNFNGQFTGNGYADFLLGLPQQTSLRSPVPNATMHGILLGAYAQDQFQLTPRLTLNFGIRWEYQGPYSGGSNLLYSFDPKNGDEVVETQAGLNNLSPYFPSNTIPVETAAAAGYPSKSLMFANHLDFYPRAGFAYRLFPRAGTVLRGGFGMYGSNVEASAGIGQLSSGGPFTGSATYINQLVNQSPSFSFPKPFQSSATTPTQTAGAVDPHMTIPYLLQWNLTVEQQLGSSASVKVAYVGSASRNLLENVNLDQPMPGTAPFSVSELAYPNYNAVEWMQNGGVDNYNSLQVSFSKNTGHNLYVDTGLTFAKDLTDEQDLGSAAGQAPENRFCIGCDYGHNGLSRRLDYYLNTRYMLPVGRGRKFLGDVNRLTDNFVGGWTVSADGSMYSGPFFSPYVNSGYDTANTNTSFDQRADLVGNPKVAHQTVTNWFNVNAFAIPGCSASDPLCANSTPVDVGRFGDVKPGSLVGPKFINYDFSLMKDFHVIGEKTFQIRMTAQNVFNHPNFEVPDWNVTDGAGVAGVITALAGASLGPREIDIVGRFSF